MDHRAIKMTTYVLVIVGALNLGIVGVLGVNVINLFLSGSPVVEKIIYILIGASAVYDIAIMRGLKTRSSKKK